MFGDRAPAILAGFLKILGDVLLLRSVKMTYFADPFLSILAVTYEFLEGRFIFPPRIGLRSIGDYIISSWMGC